MTNELTTSSSTSSTDVRKQDTPASPPPVSSPILQGLHTLVFCQQRLQELRAPSPPTSGSVILKRKRKSEENEKDTDEPSSLRTVDVQDPGSVENIRCRKAARIERPVFNHSVSFFAQFPSELVYVMFSQLDHDSLLNMLQIDSHCRDLINTRPTLYKEFLVGQAVKKMLKSADRMEAGEDKNQALCLIALLQSLTNYRKALEIAHHIPYDWRKWNQPLESLGVGLNKSGVICKLSKSWQKQI